MDAENDAGQENHMAGSLSEEVTDPNNNTIDVLPSSSSHQGLSDTRMNISFLCNPNDENHSLCQPDTASVSVQNQSWSKDCTCEQTSRVSKLIWPCCSSNYNLFKWSHY